jgi:hypothetical protein
MRSSNPRTCRNPKILLQDRPGGRSLSPTAGQVNTGRLFEARADPSVVAAWIAEELVRKSAAGARLRQIPQTPPRRLDLEQLSRALHDLGDAVAMLGQAGPRRKATIYSCKATAFAYRTDQADVIAWILAHAGDEADEINIVSI